MTLQKISLGLLAITGFSAPAISAAVLNTIATTGYNRDVIYEAGLGSATNGISHTFGSRAFFERNAYGDPTKGINQTNTGLISTATSNTINFNFQSFATSNALFVTNNTTKTNLGFSPGAQVGYSTLGFVASAANLGVVDLAEFTYTINYLGGGTQVGTFTVDDWGTTSVDGTGSVLVSSTRSATTPIPPATAGGTPGPATPFNETRDDGGGPFKFYLTEIATNSSAAILSIDFTATKLDGNGVRSGSLSDAAIFGVVGTVIPEPSSSLLVAGAFGVAALIRRRK